MNVVVNSNTVCASCSQLVKCSCFEIHFLYRSKQLTVRTLALPSPVVESIQSCQSDAKDVVVRLQECMKLDLVPLAEPDLETKQMIRCLAKAAKTENRLDVVKYLREITPAGTTGKFDKIL